MRDKVIHYIDNARVYKRYKIYGTQFVVNLIFGSFAGLSFLFFSQWVGLFLFSLLYIVISIYTVYTVEKDKGSNISLHKAFRYNILFFFVSFNVMIYYAWIMEQSNRGYLIVLLLLVQVFGFILGVLLTWWRFNKKLAKKSRISQGFYTTLILLIVTIGRSIEFDATYQLQLISLLVLMPVMAGLVAYLITDVMIKVYYIKKYKLKY